MRQCSTCGTTYTDDSLRYCLSDGAELNEIEAGEEPTVVARVRPTADKTVEMNTARKPVRIDVSQPTIAPMGTSTRDDRAKSGMSTLSKVLIAFLGLGMLGLLVAAVTGVVFYSMGGTDIADNKNVKPQPTSTPAKTNEDDMRDQIANLQKQIDEQKSKGQPTNVQTQVPNDAFTSPKAARVNSPGDGFLALRSLPDSETGERILKIPHGAMISVGSCGPVTMPARRRGRWCQASYEGYRGWVFDTYLTYTGQKE